jgi:hypothetical protein
MELVLEDGGDIEVNELYGFGKVQGRLIDRVIINAGDNGRNGTLNTKHAAARVEPRCLFLSLKRHIVRFHFYFEFCYPTNQNN